jgi:hypothetical protein
MVGFNFKQRFDVYVPKTLEAQKSTGIGFVT